MTNLEKLISEIREAAGKANERPWHTRSKVFEFPTPVATTILNKDWVIVRQDPCVSVMKAEHQQNKDFNFIVLAANNIEKLAQACEVMRGVLERLHSDIGIESKWCDCSEIALEAIEQVEKILGG